MAQIWHAKPISTRPRPTRDITRLRLRRASVSRLWSATVLPVSSIGVLSSKPSEIPLSKFGCGGPQIKMNSTPMMPIERPTVFRTCGVTSLNNAEESLTRIARLFLTFPIAMQLKETALRRAHRRSYREYSSTMSCSLTMGCISSREGIRATLPLSASRSTVSQSGTGTICVRSRFRSTS